MNARPLLGLLLACGTTAHAQAGPLVPSWGAETGVYAESYGIHGRDARLPSSTLRMYAAPTFEWLGVTVGTSLLWSTDSRFVAQPMNRFYLNPRWGWGQLHAGDFAPDISPHTASGARLRGGGVELHPGPVRLAFVGGRAQSASDLSAFDAAPQRAMWAGLLGLGERDRTFVELSALRAFDRVEGTDSISAPPQENVVGSFAAGLALFGSRLRLGGDVSGSLFSRDTRAQPLDSLRLPGWTTSLFTPRLSSRADYAWTGDARLALGPGTIGAQLRYVGPGFTTLGNPYLPSDVRETRATATLRLFRGRLAASGSFGERRDNLAGDKRGTMWRHTGTLALTGLAGDWLVSTATVMMNGLVRQPQLDRSPLTPDPGLIDSFRLSNLTVAASLVEQVRFRAWGLDQHVAVSATEQQVSDDSPRFAGLLDSRARSVALEWGVTLRELYTVTARPGYQEFAGAQEHSAFNSMTIGLTRRGRASPLVAALASTYTPVGAGSQIRHDASASYRLGDHDNVGAQLRYTTLGGVARPYTEHSMSLRLTHRW